MNEMRIGATACTVAHAVRWMVAIFPGGACTRWVS